MSKMMKCVAGVLLLGILTVHLNAQSGPDNRYLVADHMKVAPGKVQAYLDLELGPWKKIHEARVKAGIIEGWHLYRVRYPHGTNSPHDYVTVTVYSDFNNIDAGWVDMPDSEDGETFDWDAVMAQTTAARDLVCSEIWYWNDGVIVEGLAPYISVNYMKTNGGLRNFMQTEREVAKPIQQALKDAGDRAGWSVYRLMYPRGDGLPYNVATVNFHNDFASLSGTNMDAALKAGHPDATDEDRKAMWERTTSARTLVRKEIWELLESVMAPTE
ncbi:MAG TPA: hypothetical protein VK995_00915 [Oceanipulchritudo sp.]|nr:hypothetical protein [Oceanipulchritudo sp.]